MHQTVPLHMSHTEPCSCSNLAWSIASNSQKALLHSIKFDPKSKYIFEQRRKKPEHDFWPLQTIDTMNYQLIDCLKHKNLNRKFLKVHWFFFDHFHGPLSTFTLKKKVPVQCWILEEYWTIGQSWPRTLETLFWTTNPKFFNIIFIGIRIMVRCLCQRIDSWPRGPFPKAHLLSLPSPCGYSLPRKL